MIQYLKTHLFYVVLIAIGLFAFRSWLTEHDRAVAAENVTKVSEAQVKTLQAEVASIQTIAARQVQVIVKERDAIKTTTQAIPIVDAFDPALKPRPVLDSPAEVTVDAVTLARDLDSCRIDRVNLGACQATLVHTQAIIVEKQKEIDVKKPRLLKQLWHDSKTAFFGAVALEGLRLVIRGKL